MALNFVFSALPRSLKTLVRSYIWKRLNLHWVLRSGLKVEVRTISEWWIYNDIYVDGEYDLPIKLLLQSPPQGRPLEIIDLGANVGFFSVRVMDLIRQQHGREGLACQLTLIEGSPTVFQELKNRLTTLDPPIEKIRLVHGLVGKRTGQDVLTESEFHIANSISKNGHSKGATVDYVDLYSLYDAETEIDLLKCDIEGAELQFLENYQDLLAQVKMAVFELHHEMCDTARCFAIMNKLGFQHQTILRDAGSYCVCLFRR